MEAVRLDSNDRAIVFALACSNLVRDVGGICLLSQYSQLDETLAIMSAFAIVTQFSDRLDAQRFRSRF